MGFYHVSRIGLIRGFYPLLAALVERWRPETHSFVLPVGEVTVTLEDVAHIFGLPIDGEPVSGWTDSSSDFVQSQSIAIFGHQPALSSSSKSYIKLGCVRTIRDAEPLDTKESIKRYLGSACLAHLYRVLCRASRYDTKEMDVPLNLLFVWAWERLPCITPVPRQSLPPAEMPVAMRWSHSYRSKAWLSKTIEVFRKEIDNMDEFVWRPYEGLIIPDELHGHLEVCHIVAPLLSFECVEWHPANRVMCQFGYAQPPAVARKIPLREHCITLRGVQLYDWTVLHGR
ncbi:serine/threonine-protein phosphatase 7 long form homolog [Arachis hypogaea]